MNRQGTIFFVTLLLFFKAFSQQTSKISFEGGAVINKPLISGERLMSNGESTTFTDWAYKYHTSTGYFVKFSYEQKLIAKNKLSVFFPMGISYMSQITKYERNGSSWGCFGGESANELRTISNKNINLLFGPALQYQLNKFRYTGNLLLNNCFTVDSKLQSVQYTVNDTYTNTHPKFGFNLYISSQLGVMYNIKNKIWIGPTCEVFYGNGLHLIKEISDNQKPSYTPYKSYDPSINIKGKNIWINPGIKLQIDL